MRVGTPRLGSSCALCVVGVRGKSSQRPCRSTNLRTAANACIMAGDQSRNAPPRTSGKVQLANSVLRHFGGGLFHCGVEVNGMEWSYSRTACRGAHISVGLCSGCRPTRPPRCEPASGSRRRPARRSCGLSRAMLPARTPGAQHYARADGAHVGAALEVRHCHAVRLQARSSVGGSLGVGSPSRLFARTLQARSLGATRCVTGGGRQPHGQWSAARRGPVAGGHP